MASITKDSFDDTKGRTRVIAQRSSPLVDSDLNEQAKLVQVQELEVSRAASSGLRPFSTSSAYSVQAAGSEWKVTTDTTNLFVTAGTGILEGCRIHLATQVALASEGVTFSTPGADTYGFIYADIVFAEIDSSADSSIAIGGLGETAIRERISITWHKAESTTSYAAALAGITALPVVTTPRLWKGNTARVFLCRYFRANGVAGFDSANLKDLRYPTAAESSAIQRLMYVRAPSTSRSTEYTGQVSWDATTGRLALGIRGSGSLQDTGLVMADTSNTFMYAAKTSSTLYDHDAGTVNLYSASVGWTLASGECLAYAGNSTHDLHLLFKGATGTDNDSETITAFNTQKPSVVALSSLSLDEGAFVICYRTDNDIVWWNGSTTRGSETRPVVADPFVHSSPYDAVIASPNDGGGNAMREDAVNRVLNLLTMKTSASAVAALAAGRISLKVGSGTWKFARGPHLYATSTNATDVRDATYTGTNSLLIEGDGAEVTTVEFDNPVDAGRADYACFRYAAKYIRLEGLTFTQTFSTGTRKPGTTLDLYSSGKVVLKDCVFYGPVYVRAPDVIVENCTFHALGNTDENYRAFAVGSGRSGQLLHLRYAGGTSKRQKWGIRDSVFNPRADLGTEAGLILDSSIAPGHCAISGCTVDYAGNTGVPGIEVSGSLLHVEVTGSTFVGAAGVGKDGIASTDAGIVANQQTKSSVFVQGSTNHTSCPAAYIAIPDQRSAGSGLSVTDCVFDLTRVGEGVTAKYILWGGVTAQFCSTSVLGAPSAVVHSNIKVSGCRFEMGATAACGMTSGSTTNIRAVTAVSVRRPFFMRTTYTYEAYNIDVSNNLFNLGRADGSGCAWLGVVTRISPTISEPNSLQEGADVVNVCGGINTTGSALVIQEVNISGNRVVSLNEAGSYFGAIRAIGGSDGAASHQIFYVGATQASEGFFGSSLTPKSVVGVDVRGNSITLPAYASATSPVVLFNVKNARVEENHFDLTSGTSGSAVLSIYGQSPVIRNNYVYAPANATANALPLVYYYNTLSASGLNSCGHLFGNVVVVWPVDQGEASLYTRANTGGTYDVVISDYAPTSSNYCSNSP